MLYTVPSLSLSAVTSMNPPSLLSADSILSLSLSSTAAQRNETGESFSFSFLFSFMLLLTLIVWQRFNFSFLHCMHCRRDSFITHRAFCDALTEESAKAIGGMPVMAAAAQGHHPLLFSPPPPTHQVMPHHELAALQDHHQEVMKPLQQHCNYAMKPEMPPWPTMPYGHHHPLLQPLCNSAAAAQSSATSARPQQQLPTAAAHLSATALLQKAAQMGATIGGAGTGGAGAHYTQMAGASAGAATSAASSATFGLGLSCLNTQQDGNGLVPAGVMGLARTASHGRSGGGGAAGGGGDGMTRDFLGLRAFSHRDILGLAGFDSSCMGTVNATTNTSMSCYEPQQHGQAQAHAQQQQQSSNEPWHGMGSHS